MSKMNLDFKGGNCFGVQTNGWISILKAFNNSVPDMLENSQAGSEFQAKLTQAVDLAYENLAYLHFLDIDSDTDYIVKFSNQKKKWLIEIKDSKDAEVSLEEKQEIMKNDDVKKIINKITEIVFVKASDLYKTWVMPEIENGSFLDVNEAKAEALNDFLDDRELKTAFEKLTFEK